MDRAACPGNTSCRSGNHPHHLLRLHAKGGYTDGSQFGQSCYLLIATYCNSFSTQAPVQKNNTSNVEQYISISSAVPPKLDSLATRGSLQPSLQGIWRWALQESSIWGRTRRARQVSIQQLQIRGGEHFQERWALNSSSARIFLGDLHSADHLVGTSGIIRWWACGGSFAGIIWAHGSGASEIIRETKGGEYLSLNSNQPTAGVGTCAFSTSRQFSIKPHQHNMKTRCNAFFRVVHSVRTSLVNDEPD